MNIFLNICYLVIPGLMIAIEDLDSWLKQSMNSVERNDHGPDAFLFDDIIYEDH